MIVLLIQTITDIRHHLLRGIPDQAQK